MLLRALRTPRGRYPAERAAQLSGVPHRTVYEWQHKGIWIPDYVRASPMQWSYRDLVFLRLLLWFRQRGMDRPEAAERTRECRRLIKSGVVDATAVRSDGHGMILEGDDWDRMTGETVWALAAEAMEQHDLLEPIKGESDRPIFQPNLQRPSARTAVSPWVLAGEPVVRDTRVPTVSLWALQKQRALRPADIVRLYPGLTTDDVEDATDLERRLRLRAA